MLRLKLTAQETAQIHSLLGDVSRRLPSVEDEGFQEELAVLAHRLPESVRGFLNRFRLGEPPAGVCCISGYPLDDEGLGPTPQHWRRGDDGTCTRAEQVLLLLLGSLLGDAFAWATQQDGRLVHDILPIQGNEDEQVGSGSRAPLMWHTEDAFHPHRSDYLGLLCLRNPGHVVTTVASIDEIRLDAAHAKILFEERFLIRPDPSYFERGDTAAMSQPAPADELKAAAYAAIDLMNSAPQKVSVLWGHPASPYLRVDPCFMDTPEDDEEARRALDALVAAINAALNELTLTPGEFCFIDNYKAVHGRKAFAASYDGRDRWLKRINITRDLRKSRALRRDGRSRVLY